MPLGLPDTIATLPPGLRLHEDAPPGLDEPATSAGDRAAPITTKPAPAKAPAPKPAPKPPAAREEPVPEQIGKNALALRARERRLEQERDEFDHRQRTLEADRQTHAETVTSAKQILELGRAEPFQLLAALGWSREMLVERLANGGKRGTGEKIELLERQLAGMRAENERGRQEGGHRAQKENVEKELSQFVDEARASAARFPMTSQMNDGRLRARGLAIAKDHAARGKSLTNDQVLAEIERELEETAAELGTSKKPAKAPAAAPKPKAERDVLTMSDDELKAIVLAEVAEVTAASRAKDAEDDDGVDPLSLSEEEQWARTLRMIERLKSKTRPVGPTGRAHGARADGTRPR
jgi:hypothetical protein